MEGTGSAVCVAGTWCATAWLGERASRVSFVTVLLR